MSQMMFHKKPCDLFDQYDFYDHSFPSAQMKFRQVHDEFEHFFQ